MEVATFDRIDFYCYRDVAEQETGHHTYRVRWDVEAHTFTVQKWDGFHSYADTDYVWEVDITNDVLNNAALFAQDMLGDVLSGKVVT